MRLLGHHKSDIYARYIVLWMLFTFILNIVHCSFLNIAITPLSFAMPGLAGLVFGIMNARVKLLSGHLSWLANHDSLTQAYNRAYFNQKMSSLDTLENNQLPISLIVIDIDHFKRVNDTFGHQTGDEVLMRVAKLISDAKRGWDIFARYGGEEFVILAPQTDLKGAREFAERLRHLIQEQYFPTVEKVTCSIGISEYQRGQESADEFFKRADECLYRAKKEGRNRVVCGEPST